ncbi:MAG: DMT family transporter [Treponema sp.]|jgi:drug/metabolite transporter (DMT)-like permease|nr:DMT family transporter [Treponema sp.]
MPKRQQAFLGIIIGVLFWGLSFVSTKIAVPVFPPMTLGAFRFALGSLFLFFVKQRAAPEKRLEARDMPYLVGAGLIGVTLYFFFENNGVILITVSEASIITAAIPVLTMATEWLGGKLFFLKSKQVPARLGLWRWLGALLSMVGVWLMVGVSCSLSGNIQGYLYMFGAALSWVVYCFLTRPLFARRSQIFIVFWQSVFGFLGFLPFAVFEYPQWATPNPAVIAHVVFLGICCSALGYWLYTHSLAVLGVTLSSIFINLIPVVTIIAGYFLLGDRLNSIQWVGAGLVLGGVYLAMGSKAP